MAKVADCPCLDCIREELRLTESFDSGEAVAKRIADLSAKGMQHYSCYCNRGRYFVCYRGVATAQGLLPRYEGQAVSGP